MPARQHSTQVKKRPAKSSADTSKAQKVRVVAKDVAVPVKTTAKGKGKAKEGDSEVAQKKKRRNVPVTVLSDEQQSTDSDLSEDEDEERQNDQSDFGDDADVDAEDEEAIQDQGEVGAPQDSKGMLKATFFFNTDTITSCPGSQERHKTQKALLAQRRASKPHAGLISEAKRIWSLARQKNIPAAERQTHIQELMTAIRGHVKDFVLKHDASRIVQTIVKYGSQKERSEIATELKGQFRSLAQNRYSKVLVEHQRLRLRR